MKQLFEHWYILIPVFVFFVIAFANAVLGIKYGKFRKFFIAFFNCTGIFLLTLGLFYFIQSSFIRTISKNVETVAENNNQKTLNPEYLKTPNFTNVQQLQLKKAYVFLDFSGSVKPELLHQRLASIHKALNTIPVKNFYYFGSCVGELENTNISVEEIRLIQEEVCESGNKIKSYTNILKVLDRTINLLEVTADDATICLFITDDEQSVPDIEMKDIDGMKEYRSTLLKFKNAGVIFQLIKLPSVNRKPVMSSESMKDTVFYVDEVKNDVELNSKLIQIMSDRLIKSDLQPITAGNEKVNNKVVFDINKFEIQNSDKAVITFVVKNNYRSFAPLICINKIEGKNWSIIPKNQRWNNFYFSIPPDTSQTMKLPVVVKSPYSIHAVNRFETEKVTITYSIYVPGSNQYNYQKLFADSIGFTRIDKSPFNGVYSNTYLTYSETSVVHKINWWMYILYSVASFMLAFIIRKSGKPTLNGRRILVLNKQTNETFEYKHPVRNSLDEVELLIKPMRLKVSKYNLFRQPLDVITINESGTTKTTSKTTYDYVGSRYDVKLKLK